ncbi:hypothetical protein MA16_Dca015985 [Dendrobium catenatum]|uniref:Uncharacterized protein n=1 Tax=Dendrobium catenatum TaxID=906689 RepID=A0A2I0VV21_9ASPA|nr:hypothetical protein MA16_Dca015985 [Dendrobium catenatum]
MSKPFEEAYELIEEMDFNNFLWSTDRINPKRIARVYELDALSILIAQVVIISKKLNIIGVN